MLYSTQWMIAFEVWIIVEVLLGAAIYYKIKPYFVLWRAYKNPYKYVRKNIKSYRGMLKIHGYKKMVHNYLTKNSFKIKGGYNG